MTTMFWMSDCRASVVVWLLPLQPVVPRVASSTAGAVRARRVRMFPIMVGGQRVETFAQLRHPA
jgi:hypothetical protein